MTRSSSVLAVLALAFVGIAFVAPPLRVSTPRGLPDKLGHAEPPRDAGAIVMGVLAGVMVGLAVPASSWAINDLPESRGSRLEELVFWCSFIPLFTVPGTT